MTSQMNDNARVWIYQANRFLTDQEILKVNEATQEFVQSWSAHGNALAAEAHVLYKRFVVFFVDENQAEITGCSIDKSVALINGLGSELGIDFFDRMQILYRENNQIKEDRMHDFWAKRKAQIVNDQTPVFNNLVKTKGEFDSSWETVFGESWHSSMW
ncbi:MAG: ABC transporter ATPase [Flavobacteriales bacterium]